MKLIYKILPIIILLGACASNEKKVEERETRSYDFSDYDYEVRCYTGSITTENLEYTDFYRNDTLIRNIGSEEGCTRYVYNLTGQLVVEIYGRDCSNGINRFSIYDSTNNLIGHFLSLDSIIDLDTVEFDQIYFYNSNRQLIKERTYKGNDYYGEEYETWKFYTYNQGKIYSETELDNTDTIWNGRYYYDSLGNLIKIHRSHGNLYEKEFFTYDKNNQLIRHEIKSTANPITKNTSFSAGNNYTIYEYDLSGFKTSETIYNHEGKQQAKKIYKKIYK